jgi:hypothetical protein
MGKILIALFFLANQSISQNTLSFINQYCAANYNTNFSELIYVSVKKQKLYYIKNSQIDSEFTISTAKKGIGNIKNSDKTPTGLHQIKEKHGDNTPLNGKMIGRKFYGKIAEIYSDTTTSKTDDITTRILWLDGLETNINKGGNVDSFNRYIYIHGTSEEGKLGKPASHGCIRMSNNDVLELYNKVSLKTKVLILDK